MNLFFGNYKKNLVDPLFIWGDWYVGIYYSQILALINDVYELRFLPATA